MTFESFKLWAEAREADFDSASPLAEQNFNFALKQGETISYYLPQFMLEAYVFCLALHYCILSDNGALHSKYLPNDSANNNLLAVTASASNATSSLSNMSFKGLQDLSIAEATLTSTPYGIQALSIQNSLQHAVIV